MAATDRADPPAPSTITHVTGSTRAELRDRGRGLRKEVPRSSHGGWIAPPDRRDPLEVLAESNASRLPDLVPVRYERMLVSPFTYFRGAPAVMAHDLASAPATTIRPQLCGDAHLANFGLFATPERRLVFDLNDFDETLPGPFEWDVKRLAASIVVAARQAGADDVTAGEAVEDAVRAYAAESRQLATMSTLDIWYLHADIDVALQGGDASRFRTAVQKAATSARGRTNLQAFEKLTAVVDGRRVIVEDPPLVEHLPYESDVEAVREFFDVYASTLQAERRHLLHQYELVDIARKVVGVGSVGTRCFVVLGVGRADLDPLFLQIKEAQASVLEPFAGPSEHDNHGERVVVGQRLMQAASDLFLGWSRGPAGVEFFVRQLRDMKGGFDVDRIRPGMLRPYAVACARTLARAHARSLDPALVAGYLGGGRTFGAAMRAFAIDYADQTVRDHAQLVAAVEDGLVPVPDRGR